ncbi:MAG TPA: NADH-quinone oxidoreductase subunit NuoN [Alphaproteobacteria bacterium]|nr:NADH-quinone oxidoreductase subunit NuoN [Alphaproteobacteria bacterium]
MSALPDFSIAVPELVLGALTLALLMVGVFGKDRSTGLVSALSVVACVIAGILVLVTDTARATSFESLFVVDGFAAFMKVLVLIGSALSIVMSSGYLARERISRPEFPALILLATIGMMLMVSANDILSLYVGLELQSLALYVLAAFARDNVRSSEAGLKYFVLGGLASGILLYGATLVYGFAGTTNFEKIAALPAGEGAQAVGLLIGMALVAVGLIFKVSAVPFHMWTPDVYEGAPTPVTAMFAIAPKIAAMALLVRLLVGAFGALVHEWQQVILTIAVASMLWGGYAAIVQRNIKRLMAYSSIANVGYILLGLAAGTDKGVQSVLIYLAIYLFMTAGAFAVILAMRRNGRMVEDISELAGLAQSRPMLALSMAIFMFSLGGIPPLAGFIGKVYVFYAAIDAGNHATTALAANWLYVSAALGATISVVSMFYYLWIIKVIYFDPPAAPLDKPAGAGLNAALTLTAAFTLLFTLAPIVGPVVGWATAAAHSIVH